MEDKYTDNRNSLYDVVKASGIMGDEDLGTKDDFSKMMTDKDRVGELHDILEASGQFDMNDFGTADDMYNSMNAPVNATDATSRYYSNAQNMEADKAEAEAFNFWSRMNSDYDKVKATGVEGLPDAMPDYDTFKSGLNDQSIQMWNSAMQKMTQQPTTQGKTGLSTSVFSKGDLQTLQTRYNKRDWSNFTPMDNKILGQEFSAREAEHDPSLETMRRNLYDENGNTIGKVYLLDPAKGWIYNPETGQVEQHRQMGWSEELSNRMNQSVFDQVDKVLSEQGEEAAQQALAKLSGFNFTMFDKSTGKWTHKDENGKEVMNFNAYEFNSLWSKYLQESKIFHLNEQTKQEFQDLLQKNREEDQKAMEKELTQNNMTDEIITQGAVDAYQGKNRSDYKEGLDNDAVARTIRQTITAYESRLKGYKLNDQTKKMLIAQLMPELGIEIGRAYAHNNIIDKIAHTNFGKTIVGQGLINTLGFLKYSVVDGIGHSFIGNAVKAGLLTDTQKATEQMAQNYTASEQGKKDQEIFHPGMGSNMAQGLFSFGADYLTFELGSIAMKGMFSGGEAIAKACGWIKNSPTTTELAEALIAKGVEAKEAQRLAEQTLSDATATYIKSVNLPQWMTNTYNTLKDLPLLKSMVMGGGQFAIATAIQKPLEIAAQPMTVSRPQLDETGNPYKDENGNVITEEIPVQQEIMNIYAQTGQMPDEATQTRLYAEALDHSKSLGVYVKETASDMAWSGLTGSLMGLKCIPEALFGMSSKPFMQVLGKVTGFSGAEVGSMALVDFTRQVNAGAIDQMVRAENERRRAEKRIADGGTIKDYDKLSDDEKNKLAHEADMTPDQESSFRSDAKFDLFGEIYANTFGSLIAFHGKELLQTMGSRMVRVTGADGKVTYKRQYNPTEILTNITANMRDQINAHNFRKDMQFTARDNQILQNDGNGIMDKIATLYTKVKSGAETGKTEEELAKQIVNDISDLQSRNDIPSRLIQKLMYRMTGRVMPVGLVSGSEVSQITDEADPNNGMWRVYALDGNGNCVDEQYYATQKEAEDANDQYKSQIELSSIRDNSVSLTSYATQGMFVGNLANDILKLKTGKSGDEIDNLEGIDAKKMHVWEALTDENRTLQKVISKAYAEEPEELTQEEQTLLDEYRDVFGDYASKDTQVEDLKTRVANGLGITAQQIDRALEGHTREEINGQTTDWVSIGNGMYRTKDEQTQVDAYIAELNRAGKDPQSYLQEISTKQMEAQLRAEAQNAHQDNQSGEEAQNTGSQISNKETISGEITTALLQNTPTPETARATATLAYVADQLKSVGIDTSDHNALMDIVADESNKPEIRQMAQMYLDAEEALSDIDKIASDEIDARMQSVNEKIDATEMMTGKNTDDLGIGFQSGKIVYVKIKGSDETLCVREGDIDQNGNITSNMVKLVDLEGNPYTGVKGGITLTSNLEIEEVRDKQEMTESERQRITDYVNFQIDAIKRGGFVKDGEEILTGEGTAKVLQAHTDETGHIVAGQYDVQMPDGKTSVLTTDQIYDIRTQAVANDIDAQMQANANKAQMDAEKQANVEAQAQAEPEQTKAPERQIAEHKAGDVIEYPDNTGIDKVWQVIAVSDDGKQIHLKGDNNQFMTISAEDIQKHDDDKVVSESMHQGAVISLPDEAHGGAQKDWIVTDMNNGWVYLKSSDGAWKGMSVKDYQNAVRRANGIPEVEETIQTEKTSPEGVKGANKETPSDYQQAMDEITLDEEIEKEEAQKKAEEEARRKAGRDKNGKLVSWPVDDNGNVDFAGLTKQAGDEAQAGKTKGILSEVYDMLENEGGKGSARNYAISNLNATEKAIEKLQTEKNQISDVDPIKMQEQMKENAQKIKQLTAQRNFMRQLMDEHGRRQIEDKNFSGIVETSDALDWKKLSPQWYDWMNELAKQTKQKIKFRYGLTNESGVEINGENRMNGVIEVNLHATHGQTISEDMYDIMTGRFEDITPDKNVRTVVDYLASVMGHEITHTIFKENPKKAEEFRSFVEGYIGKDTYDAIRQRKLQNSKVYNEKNVDEEICADMAGQLFSDAKFLRSLLGLKTPEEVEADAQKPSEEQFKDVHKHENWIQRGYRAVSDWMDMVLGFNDEYTTEMNADDARPEAKAETAVSEEEANRQNTLARLKETYSDMFDEAKKSLAEARENADRKQTEEIRKAEEERQKAREKRDKQMADAKARYDARIKQARKQYADDPDALAMLDESEREARTLEEYVAENLPEHGIIFKSDKDTNTKGMTGETGLKYGDLKGMSYFMGKRENGAKDIDGVAEKLYADMPENIRTQCPDAEESVREQIISLLTSGKSVDEILHMVDDNRIAEASSIYEANRAREAYEEEQMKQDPQYSERTKPAPEKTGIGYKVFYQDPRTGKLYPPMVANPDGADTPVGIWLDADAAPIAGESKTGRPQVKSGGKGTAGGSGPLSYRPGWHLGEIPYALQFNKGEKVDNPQGIRNKKGDIIKVGKYFPKNYVWAEVEYSKDNDYQKEAEQNGYSENGNYRHAYAGLQHLPEDGYYRYRTNANPATDPWIITGSMKVNKILTKDEVDDLVRQAGREPQIVEGTEEPSKAFSVREQIKTDPETAIKKMDVTEPDPEYQDVTTDRRGNVISAINEETNQAMFSERTFDEGGREIFNEFLGKQVAKHKETKGKQGISEGMARKLRRQMEDMYDEAKRIREEGNFTPYTNWSMQEVDRDQNGDAVFSVIKANGDYDMNLDFSLLCKKRRTLDAVLSELITRGLIDQADVNMERLAFVNDIIRAYGFETACKLCFVDARRFRTQEVSESFCKMWNDMVKAMIPEGSEVEVDSFNFAQEGGVYQPEGSLLKDKENWELSPEIQKRVEEVRNANENASGEKVGDNPKSVAYKVWEHLMEHPEDRRLLRVGDFMNTRGFDAVSAQNRRILSLYNSKKGTGGPKASFGDVQYLGDIAKTVMNQGSNGKWTPEKAYAVGGVRIQSFSDYVPHLFFDYVQMMGDLAAGKFPAHAYTKEKDFVYQFGLTGLKINMSLVPKAYEEDWIKSGKLIRVKDKEASQRAGSARYNYIWASGKPYTPGLDEDGNYIWETGETFDYDEAMVIQNAKGYRDNCGTIAVGISDAHIRKMLADPNIRMVIPYHKSSLPFMVALHNNIDSFTDYTEEQTTKGPMTIKNSDARKAWVAKNEPSFNSLLRQKKSAIGAAKAYLDWCNENGCTPKFSRFLNKDRSGKYHYTDGYYKMLEDFTCAVPDGKGNVKYRAQKPIKMKFPKENDAFGTMGELIRKGLEADTRLEEARDNLTSDMVDTIEQSMMGNDKGLPEIREGESITDYAKRMADWHKTQKGYEIGSKFSERISDKDNEEYMKVASSHSPKDIKTASDLVKKAATMAMPDSKVKDKDGYLLPVYHDTNSTVWINKKTGENFDDLDWKDRDYWQDEASQEEWDDNWEEQDFYAFDNTKHGRSSVEVPGFFFAPEMDEYHEYGNRTIKAYLNITNPIIDPEIPNQGRTNTAGRDAMNEWIKQGYDGMIRTNEDGSIDEYVAFFPNQIKSARTIERDKDGKIIPLKDRFNFGTNDFRYSERLNAEQEEHKYNAYGHETFKYSDNALKEWANGMERIINPDPLPSTDNLTDYAKARMEIYGGLKNISNQRYYIRRLPSYKAAFDVNESGYADPKKVAAISSEMVDELKTLKITYQSEKADWIKRHNDDPNNEGVRAFDEDIKDIDDAIKWYEDFGKGKNNKLGDHYGIRYSERLNAEQEKRVKSDKFKAWFGDWENDPENASKVVDEEGKPLIVHHGTDSYGFTIFDTRQELKERRDLSNIGSHFGEKGTAEEFGDEMYNVYLDIKKPWEAPYDFFADNYNNAYLDALETLRSDINTPEADKMFKDRIQKIYPNLTDEMIDRFQNGDELIGEMFDGDEGLEDDHIHLTYQRGKEYSPEEKARRQEIKDAWLNRRNQMVELLKDLMKIGGYDGIKYENWYEGEENNECWIALEPNQIKSADTTGEMANNGEFDASNPDIRYSDRIASADPFYSNAAKGLEQIKQEKGNGLQWIAMLKKNGALKAEEDKWMGLSDWLKDKKSVTKKEIEDFIAENSIKVEEVHYDENGTMTEQQIEDNYEDLPHSVKVFHHGIQDEFADLRKSGLSFDEAYQQMEDKYGENFSEAYDKIEQDPEGDLQWIYMDPLFKLSGLKNEGETTKANAINDKRLEYTTKGLQHKHEIALTIPTIEPYAGDLPEIHFADEFTDGKTIAWARFGDATDTDGNKVLVVDEIQSQRHQDARKSGYRSKEQEEEMKRYLAEREDINARIDEADRKGIRDYDLYNELRANNVKIEALKNTQGIPDAPFQKNWHELAMKRVLRYAAENGYDKVAWTTGTQQAKRYDIGNTITRIERLDDDRVVDTEKGERIIHLHTNEARDIAIGVDADGKVTFSSTNADAFTDKPLSAVIGKEYAEKAMALNDNESFKLDKEQFLGGDGMKGFYDNMLVKYMNKYGKKWGVSVKDVTLDLPNEEDRVMHSVDVNEAMKESVMSGQPMFSERNSNPNSDGKIDPQTITDNFKHWFGDWQKDPQNASKVVDENGRPLVVYHGGPDKINIFDESKRGSSTGTNGSKMGFFFTDNKNLADAFADYYGVENQSNIDKIDNASDDKITSSAFNYAKNMEDAVNNMRDFKDFIFDNYAFELTKKGTDADISDMTDEMFAQGCREYLKRNVFMSDKEQLPEVKKIYKDLGMNIGNTESVYLDIKNPYVYDKTLDYTDNVTEGTMSSIIQKAKEKGNDGVIFKDVTEVMSDNNIRGQQIVVFKPEQIKSATDNNGDFDPQNPDIRYSERGDRPNSDGRGSENASGDEIATANARYSERDNEEARGRVIAELKNMIDDKLVSSVRKSDLNRMLTLVSNAKPSNLFDSVKKAESVVRTIKTEQLGHELDNLLKLKVQDRNNKNMSIAKNVDNETRQIVEHVRNKFYGVMETEEDKGIRNAYRENFQYRREINLRMNEMAHGTYGAEGTPEYNQAQTEIDNLKDQIEQNNETIRNLRAQRRATVMAQVQRSSADLQTDIDAKIQKMSEHCEAEALGDHSKTWTKDDARELTELEILKARMDIESVDEQIDQLKQDRSGAESAGERRGYDYLIEDQERQRLEKVQDLVNKVRGVVEGGKESLYAQKQAQAEHKIKLIRGTLNDIRGGKTMPAESDKRPERGVPNKWRAFFTGPLKTFEYMASAIDENHMSGDGWFYKYFMQGKHGVMEAHNQFLNGYKDAMRTLRDKVKEISGKKADKFADDGRERVKDHGVTMVKENVDEFGNVTSTERVPLHNYDTYTPDTLSKNNAMYLYMAWQMPDGRAKMEAQGFDETSIEEMKEFMGDARVKIADYIQKEYLPSLFPKYQAKYTEIYGTPMADIPNYVPLKINGEAIQQKSNLMDPDGNMVGTLQNRNGFMINRTANLKPLKLDADAFDVIQKHIYDSEEFTAYANVRQDLDAILGSNAIKKQLNANQSGLYQDLVKASAIAVRSEQNDPVGGVEKALVAITRGIVGSNIAFRFGTALKQTTSFPAFWAYRNDGDYQKKFLWYLVKDYAQNFGAILEGSVTLREKMLRDLEDGKWTPLNKDFEWAFNNVPSFRDRVTTGNMGMDILTPDGSKGIRAWITSKGMGANQMVDAITCLTGIKAIYEFNMDKARKSIDEQFVQKEEDLRQSIAESKLTPEAKAEKLNNELRNLADEKQRALDEAHRVSVNEADIAYNSSQQSSHEAFLAPIQTNPHLLQKQLMAYKNSPVSYARYLAKSIDDFKKLLTKRDQMIEAYKKDYMMLGKSEEDAEKEAKKQIGIRTRQDLSKISVYGFILGAIWVRAGQGLYGFFTDDEQDEAMVSTENVPSYISGGGMPGYDMLNNLASGKTDSPFLLWQELADIKQKFPQLWKQVEEDQVWGSYQLGMYAFQKASRIYGVDSETIANMAFGMEEMMREGFSQEDIALNMEYFINLSKTNRKSTAKVMYKDMDLDDQLKIVLKAGKIFDDNDPRRWLPGAKKMTKERLSEIYSELAAMRIANKDLKDKPMTDKEMTDVVSKLSKTSDCEQAFNGTDNETLRKKILARQQEIDKDADWSKKAQSQKISEVKQSYAERHQSKTDSKKAQSDLTKGKAIYKLHTDFKSAREDQQIEDEWKRLREDYADKVEDMDAEESYAFDEAHKADADLYYDLKDIRDDINELKTDLAYGDTDMKKTLAEIAKKRAEALTLIKKSKKNK